MYSTMEATIRKKPTMFRLDEDLFGDKIKRIG